MINRFLILLVTVGVLFLTSCVDVDDISLLGSNGMEIEGLTKITTSLKMENKTNRNLSLKSGDFQLYYNDKHVGDISMEPTATLFKRSVQDINLTLNLDFNSLTAAYNVLKAASSQPDRLSISGEGVIKSGCLKKRIKLKNMPVSNIISIFADE